MRFYIEMAKWAYLTVYILFGCGTISAKTCVQGVKKPSVEMFNLDQIAERLSCREDLEVNFQAEIGPASGQWNGKVLSISKNMPFSKKGIVAHEVVHVTTDSKLYSDPTPLNLSKAIRFRKLKNQPNLGEIIGAEMPPKYRDYFRRDEIHANKKQSLVLKVLAEASFRDRELADGVEFSGLIKISHKAARNFSGYSEALLELALDYAKSEHFQNEAYIQWQPPSGQRLGEPLTLPSLKC